MRQTTNDLRTGSIYHLGPELVGLSFTGPLLERIVSTDRDEWTFVELWNDLHRNAEVVHQRHRFRLESTTQLVDAIESLVDLGIVQTGHRSRTVTVDRHRLDDLVAELPAQVE